MTAGREPFIRNFHSRVKVCSAGAALVRPGDKVAISANASAPAVFLKALYGRAGVILTYLSIRLQVMEKISSSASGMSEEQAASEEMDEEQAPS